MKGKWPRRVLLYSLVLTSSFDFGVHSAGFAGGIVSAAVDGLAVAMAVVDSLNMTSSTRPSISLKERNSVSAFY